MKPSFNIFQVSPLPEDDLPEELQQYEGNLETSLQRFKAHSGGVRMWKFPNFQFGWLAPPQGWVMQFNSNSLFKQYPFLHEKYRTITVVELDVEESFFTPQKLQQMEGVVRKFFPKEASCRLEDTRSTGWCPGIGERGCQIGIYQTKVPIPHKDELRHIHYLVAHTSLPDILIDELQEHERMVQRSCDEYEMTNGVVRQEYLQKAKPNTLEEEFGAQGVQSQMRSLAQELGIRSIIHYCQLTGLKTLNPLLEMDTEDDLEPPLMNGAPPSKALLDQALLHWPQDAIMCPFSELPQLDELKALKGYKIGYAVHLAMKAGIPLPNVRFDNTIYTLLPTLQTTYNTFKLVGGQLFYYANTTPISDYGGQPLAVQRGLELGFEIYNFDPITHQPLDGTPIKNEFGNGFPSLLPFKKEKRDFAPTTLTKFFSMEAGGSLQNHRVPAQLQGRFSSHFSPHDVELLLPIQNQKPISLTPIQVFLSPLPPPGPIYTYDNINGN